MSNTPSAAYIHPASVAPMNANPAPIDDGPDCDGSTACPADVDVHDEGCHALAAIAAAWAFDDIVAQRH